MGDGLWFIVHEFLLLMGYLFFGELCDKMPLLKPARHCEVRSNL
ncbi:MAG: hypothetical protein JWR38_442 [Mucilaginibacter sp.]|nr:hypothetical protein [Mucilaginibacter sp.]